MAIEKAPSISQEELLTTMLHDTDSQTKELVNKINDTFEYWDTVKYKRSPDGCSAKQLWALVKAERAKSTIQVWKRYKINISLTNQMLRVCHEIDVNWRDTGETSPIIRENDKKRYLASSLMEEAIFSSLMEGASTTRKVAKEMLRKKTPPKDKSQQMISNNYQTIQFIVSHKDTPLSPELLLHIHRLMTENTLQSEQEGHFRSNDDVVVENGITHETVHTPPSHNEIPAFIDDLCHFFNEQDTQLFIHPIIRGILIHFMIAYVHPFADGNGRTARALFYWYMLRQGYWLTEYLSISRVIAKSKKSYEKAFLYAESDGLDIGYFVAYNLRALQQSFKQLQDYISRKQNENKDANIYLHIGNINKRQALIIKMFADDPNLVITVSDLRAKFQISPTTAKADITGLTDRGILAEIAFNKVKKGYIKGDLFDETIPNWHTQNQ